MKSNAKVTGVVAAIVATAGAAVAITFLVWRKAKRPGSIIDRCDRAVGELERQMTYAPGNC